ncbi:hypothetical protein SNE25_08165 [Mucilaginibacter sabulilitoris]|uniref:Pectate lyase superfamily protein domain-containing protein n=1 Tax=Mucilaginibacter sabulilitoris TaxID=1173583 RepID=A0ABZ0TRV3_9SPHI|nr:hypothetical protein [Mucilaginibacter sabulilitoris]WPU95496.1 hypothetical protein SNE25_08165 [Mucilaginibacter sabulilitoris]
MKRANDTLYDVLDRYTGDYTTYEKVTTDTDGTGMTDAKCDGVLYKKLITNGVTEYFRAAGIPVLDVMQFGATGSPSGDDSEAFAKVIEWVGRHKNTIEGLSTDAITLSIRCNSPTGVFRIAQPQKMMAQAVAIGGGRRIGLRYFSDNRTAIKFDAPESAPANTDEDVILMYNGNQFQYVRFERLKFIGTNAKHVLLYSSANGGAQDYMFHDCDFFGTWKNQIKVRGSNGANNNSEWKFEACAFSLNCKTLWDIADSDQFLNFWASKCKFWLSDGEHIRCTKGGHFAFWGCDWSGLTPEKPVEANTSYLFNLLGNTRARGVCSFTIHHGRFEHKTIYSSLMYCEWNIGNVTFDNVDCGSQASLVTGINDTTQVYFNPGTTGGPIVSFNNCSLIGRHQYDRISGPNYSAAGSSIAYYKGCNFELTNNLDSRFVFGGSSTIGTQWIAVVEDSKSTTTKTSSGAYKIYTINANYNAIGMSGANIRPHIVCATGADKKLPFTNGVLGIDLPLGARIRNVVLYIEGNTVTDSYNYNLEDGAGNIILSLSGTDASVNNNNEATRFISVTTANRSFIIRDIANQVNAKIGACLITYI